MALLLMRYDGMRTRPIRAGWVVWRLPDAVMHARRFTARTLRHWKAEDVADAVLLVVSELVTNALVHTQGAGPPRSDAAAGTGCASASATPRRVRPPSR